MEQYHQRSLRKILRISWKDRHTNISILEEANMTSITTTIMQYQLRWTGHVIRMPNTDPVLPAEGRQSSNWWTKEAL